MPAPKRSSAERRRLAAADAGRMPWRHWGPYVSERAWGTVREDYSANGDAWSFFPHDHARSRAFRWSEDGLAGVCDETQTWCLGLALWNGVDPFLKERAFGLTGHEGNHGEDVKDYWWYVDATPTHSWMRWRYHYPQRAFPYADLVDENGRRSRRDPEYELADTGVFDDHRYWVVQVDYAKAAPTDLLMRIRVTNRSPDEATLHVLPSLWYRNTWAWGFPDASEEPQIVSDADCLVSTHPVDGSLTLTYDGAPSALFCDNESNAERLFGSRSRSRYPKDGINDHVVGGAPTVNPAQRGTKSALHYVVTAGPGATAEIRLRLREGHEPADVGRAFDSMMARRQREADEFYAELAPAVEGDDALVLRQACAGMLWGKQFYHYDVDRWLAGDPAGPSPPTERLSGRNSGWRHLNNHDVISMPDKWEYPWYAAWDLAFHCVALARLDPWFAKRQLVLMCREWYMHPSGQLPAYEWSFGDANPPVHAWAALKVFELDGSKDFDFLERIFHKLLLNFTWWVNRKDTEGNNVFEGGFLGLDNVGPFDRSSALPVAGHLDQSDATAWMALFCLDMWEMALVLAERDGTYEDMAIKFFEHFAYIASAASELWDDTDGFYYDQIRADAGWDLPLRVRSMVGLLPICATTTIGTRTVERLPDFAAHMLWFLEHKPQYSGVVAATYAYDGAEGQLLSVVDESKLRRLATRLLDENEFLSDYGIRSVSKAHLAAPFVLDVGGGRASVDYEPAESTTPLFGGNSNWRGPVWFPTNYLIVEALGRYARFYGDELTLEHPTGSGRSVPLTDIADDLAKRLVSIFLRDPDGRRPVFGDRALFQTDPDWRDLVPFHEYFHGDSGAGLGASHQTGWTGLVADLIIRRSRGSGSGLGGGV